MAATTGAVPRFQFSRSNTTVGHHDNILGSVPMPKSAASATAAMESNDGLARHQHDPKAKKDKTNSFKRHLAAARNSRNDETIRRKMAMLKEQKRTAAGGRYPNGAKTPIQRDMEAEAKSRVESELGRPVSSNEWPFVYFVVSVDQMPQQIVNGEEGGDGTARSMQTARQRQRFLVSRRRKIQEARQETERIREANIDMGLRLEPIKPQAQLLEHQNHLQRMRTRPSLTKHPPTPVSSVGSKHEFHFLNSHDDLSDIETRRSIGMIITDTLNEAGLGPRGGVVGGGGGGATGRSTGSRHCPVSTLELPEISAGTKRRALGTSPYRNRDDGGERKMVTFADGLPVIKGNRISVLGVKPVDPNASHSASASCSTSLVAKSGASPRAGETNTESSGGSFLQPPWSAPLSLRSLNSYTSKSRLYTPMALPKIDIVSEIYDELIVKTIQNYLMVEGYSQEKFHQLRQTILARLSATYPHLVKHKAWRQEPSGADGQGSPTRESSTAVPGTATGMAPAATVTGTGDLSARQRFLRSGTLPSRLGQSSDELVLTSSDNFSTYDHNVRPVKLCPFFYPGTPGVQHQVDLGLGEGWVSLGGGIGGGNRASTFHVPRSPFMSIDGRTMTITPRCSPQSFQLGTGPNQGSTVIPRLEGLQAPDPDFIMAGWTPPPNKLPSTLEEEPSALKTCPAVEECRDDGLGNTESAIKDTPYKREENRTEANHNQRLSSNIEETNDSSGKNLEGSGSEKDREDNMKCQEKENESNGNENAGEKDKDESCNGENLKKEEQQIKETPEHGETNEADKIEGASDEKLGSSLSASVKEE
ncbi:hypothetical protein PoB_005445100 [Plakobranchus ocellatus]|uniref:Uncharacterized protein n=1 Tax=Plakobranchus ocellatus TaxID=259542 RepID=A0AAV4C9F5_9GAST|nr:hypothetical protein PoB_005445100 [Plakobranchus ocellatus]